MKKLIIITIFLSINACSSSPYSKHKIKDLDPVKVNSKKIANKEIMSMSMNEFKIYIENYIKNSPYPILD